MTARCPSELALEAHLLEPERSPLSAHLAGCARCAARLEQMRLEGDDFARYVFPATVDAVEAAAARRPWWRRPALVLPVPIVAALAAVLIFVGRSGPPEDYVGLKGGAEGVGLALFASGPAGAAPVPDGGAVGAGAPLRFRVRAPADCHLWILSTDATGTISRLHPASGGQSQRVLAGEQDLPGGAILDGQVGPERVYALCTPQALPWPAAEAAVRAASAPPASVRRPAPLSALPPGAAWTSTLLEKRP